MELLNANEFSSASEFRAMPGSCGEIPSQAVTALAYTSIIFHVPVRLGYRKRSDK